MPLNSLVYLVHQVPSKENPYSSFRLCVRHRQAAMDYRLDYRLEAILHDKTAVLTLILTSVSLTKPIHI